MESIYLNKTKALHKIQYEKEENSPEEEKKKAKKKGKYNKINKKINQKDLKSNTLLFFKEQDLIKNDIKQICSQIEKHSKKIFKNKKILYNLDCIIIRVQILLKKYIEKPSLLDNIIQEVLDLIITQLRNFLKKNLQLYRKKKTLSKKTRYFVKQVNIITILTQIRGVNNIKKYLGHETSDFEPLIFYLISGNAKKAKLASNVNVFLINWLSVILLIPFEFKRMDSFVIREFYEENYFRKDFRGMELLIIDFLKMNLRDTEKIGKAIGSCVAVIFRRPEMFNIREFNELLEWGLDEIGRYEENNSSMTYCANIYQLLGCMIKNCQREFLVEIHQELFRKFLEVDHELSTKNVNDKMKYGKLKIIIVFLDKLLLCQKDRWVYKKEKKDLKKQLEIKEKVQMITNTVEFKKNEASEEKNATKFELDSEIHNLQYIHLIEKSIDFLLEGLQDENSKIRYLSSKGLSSISKKLPENLSDEILETVLSLFQKSNRFTMHGINLLISEFTRKGILSPKFLPKVSKILNKSLLFEEIQGIHSKGNTVRDSACFIVWSLSRFYEKNIMKPFISEFSKNLLITALFDKDGNCRKAAAASFQENVGRQGGFKNGIEIISEMDYFSVGSKTNSFFKIGPFVAGFGEYTRGFVEHLAKVKLFHFEIDMRFLSAKSLGIICLLDLEFVINDVIPFLIENSRSEKLVIRHGSIVGLATIVMAISGNCDFMIQQDVNDLKKENIFKKRSKINEKLLTKHGKYMEDFLVRLNSLKLKNFIGKIDSKILEEITLIPKFIENNGYLKGLGGQICRIAINYLICGISKAKIDLETKIIKDYFDIIESSFRTTIDEIQEITNIALKHFSETYYENNINIFSEQVKKYCIRMDKEKLKDIKKSFCFGISAFPDKILLLNKEIIFKTLIRNSKRDKKIKMNDPEIRKFCVFSISRIYCQIEKLENNKELFLKIVKAFLQTINDYTVDKRGDIGLIIRDQTMDSIFEIMDFIIKNKTKEEIANYYTSKVLINQIGGLFSQIFSGNDKLRLKSGFLFQIIVKEFFAKFLDFPGKKLIAEIFNYKVLQNKVKDYEYRYLKSYDVGLLDNKKFLSYEDNINFVFFWDNPKCCFQHLKDLLTLKNFNYNIIRGLILSISSSNVKISKESTNILIDLLEDNENLQKMIFENIYTLAKKKKQDKFYIAAMKTLNILIKLELAEFDKMDLNKNLIDFIFDKSQNTRNIEKLKISSNVFCTLLVDIELKKNEHMTKYKNYIEFFMFNQFPIVRSEFLQGYYLYLISCGEEIFGEEICEELSELISAIDLSNEGQNFYYLFKEKWRKIHLPPSEVEV